ncbi:MAG TPA: hypothetical protein VK810_06885 [Dongiaceae bacterium]|jgi:hypothetical protein|nr:hypothetical protein [Dongiaceae bacterium]
MAKIRLADCLWVRSPSLSEQRLFNPITRALQQKNCRLFSLRLKTDPESLTKLKQLLWKTDDHVILHGLWPFELRALKPLLQERKNFSVLLVDWWQCPFWFTQNAEYVLFNLYGGIAARTRAARFANGWKPPLFAWPERLVQYELACAALRPAALFAQPFLEQREKRLRAEDVIRPERLIYFPIPVSAEDLPFQDEKPEHDLCNTGATCGFWVIRDPYASARYNFVNLYSDRKRLSDLILKLEGRPYTVFDSRRFRQRLPWETYCSSVRQSRFAICTGGIHQASVPKYIEYACFGTPMIGATLPYEFPWLDQCVFPIDGLHITPDGLKEKLKEAFELQPKLRQNCLELRDTLLRMYDPVRVFDMAQDQIDGKPIPPGYLREA